MNERATALVGCAEWDWSEEVAAWEDSPGTETAVRADHAAAVEWYQQARERGEDVSGICLQESSSLSSACMRFSSVLPMFMSNAHDSLLAACGSCTLCLHVNYVALLHLIGR